MSKDQLLNQTPLFAIANRENQPLGMGCPESGLHIFTYIFTAEASAQKHLASRDSKLKESCAVAGPFENFKALTEHLGFQGSGHGFQFFDENGHVVLEHHI